MSRAGTLPNLHINISQRMRITFQLLETVETDISVSVTAIVNLFVTEWFLNGYLWLII